MDLKNKTIEELKAMLEDESLDEVTRAEIEKEIKAREEHEEKKKEQRSFNFLTGTQKIKRNPDEPITASREYRSGFYKTLLGQSMNTTEKSAYDLAKSERRADAYNTATSAAAVLPTQTLNEVVAKARERGDIVANARQFNIPARLSIPIATPAARATWHIEGAAVDREANTLRSVSFDAFELMQIFSMSLKVQKTSIPAFESYLAQELADSLFATLDYAAVNGTGNNEPLGLLNGITWDTSNTVQATGPTIGYSDLVKAAGMLKAGYAQGAAWAMSNQTLYTSIFGAMGSDKPFFLADAQEAELRKILGFDKIIDDNLPANTILLGNFNKYLGINMPEGILIESSRESGFTRGVIDIRGLAIVDVKVLVPEAFIKIEV